ncbi:hypothetical protein FACS1894151_11600 [Spirochaetia bacterium]|nr:hypothetical protein FACS1894151_11600 [Spirochaetia bacterium]
MSNREIAKIMLSVILFTNCFFLYSVDRKDPTIMNKNGDVVLELESSSSELRIGEELILTYRIKNKSSVAVTILPWFLLFGSNTFLVFFDQDGKQLNPDTNVVYELKFHPDKEDFVLIEPGRSYEVAVSLQCDNKGPVELHGRFYNGPYIYLSRYRSYIFLNDITSITVQGIYNLNRFQIEDMFKLGFDNGVTERLYSKMITLTFDKDQ